ncbi:MAG: glycosyltransferase family 2 protein [Deltaproteobacteria bacterium]
MSAAARPFAVVVTYNGGDTTHACVASLRADASAGVEILVVDNASAEPERQRLRDDWAGAEDVELLLLGDNRHFAGGVNAGAARALARGATHLLFLNNDTVIESGCIGHLIAAAKAHPEAGIVGPILLDLSDRRPLSLGENYAAWSLALPRALLKVRRPAGSSYPVGGIMGSAILVTAPCFRRLGPYREDLLVYYEEVDYCLRARAAGFQPRIAAQAVVLHDGMRGFVAGLQPYAARLKCRNQLRLAWDHGGVAAMVVFLPSYLVLVAASSLIYACRGERATVAALWRGVVEGIVWLARGRP